MTTVVYDGTFEGFLSAVFEVYEYKLMDVKLTTEERLQPVVFSTVHKSYYVEQKAARVWKGLTTKISAAGLSQLYKAFLSEQAGIEDILLQYVQYAFKMPGSIESDFSNKAVLTVVQTARRVSKEKHRMEAFIRFQLTGDKIYYAVCEPDCNVLPLIGKHFKNRHADQKWLIYDSRRKYGIYYNLTDVEQVQLTFNIETNTGNNITLLLDENEMLYQQLWQQYFKSVNIAARKNTRLHIQHMPKRYWRYLTEKKPY